MNENHIHNETQFMIDIGLPNVLIKNVKINGDGHYEITVQSTLIGTICHKCGEYTTKFHGDGREICLRDLSIFGVPVFIKMAPKRYECNCCNTTTNTNTNTNTNTTTTTTTTTITTTTTTTTTTQQPEWYYQRSPNTLRFEEHILLQLINYTIQDVAKKENVTYDTVEGIIDRHIKAEVDWEQFKTLEVLGID